MNRTMKNMKNRTVAYSSIFICSFSYFAIAVIKHSKESN